MLPINSHFILSKYNGLLRYLMVYFASGIFPLYIVNEYPKSGGSWLGSMLSDALQVPFPRNRYPVFQTSIMHGHYIRPGKMKNVIIMWRDGRDVLVSQYYHYLFKNDRNNSRLVDITRSNLSFKNYYDIKNNLVEFMEYIFSGKGHPKFSWSDFVNIWSVKKDVIHVKYENMVYNTVIELQKVVTNLTSNVFNIEEAKTISDKYSFERQSGRKPGQENMKSFLRKGIVGDWKNHFTNESRVLFNRFAGQHLIDLGYEKDESWIIY